MLPTASLISPCDSPYGSFDITLRLRALRSVLRPALFPVGHARGIERAADDVITNAGEILHAAPANQHDRVFLQVVPDSGYISGYFDSVGEPHASHFPQRRIRLLGSGRVYARTDPTLLRAAIQRRTGSFPAWRLPPVTHKLVKRWHEFPLRGDTQQKYGATRSSQPDRNSPDRNSPDLNSEDYCFGQAHILFGVTDRTSGPHPRPDPPTRRVVAQEQKACSRETLRSYMNWHAECNKVVLRTNLLVKIDLPKTAREPESQPWRAL